MATFKVGQRVKRARDPLGGAEVAAHTTMPIGATGTVTAGTFGDFPRIQPDSGRHGWYCDPTTLEPLTDPKADQFIEWVKKIKPEPVAVPVAELQRTK